MVALSTIFSGLALIALSKTVEASAIADELVLPVADVLPLDNRHPAYGAAVDPELFKPVTPINSTAGDVDARSALHEDLMPMESGSHSDLHRLERHFRQRLERRVQFLPRQAAHQPVPWPGSYWPIYQDSINARHSNDASPAEKYARAFGLNIQQFMNRVSTVNGVYSQSHRPRCRGNLDCRGLNDGSQCAKREGQSQGFCIPTWFGICHAWAPAAMVEAEPRCPVVRNGVTFSVSDIKALLTAAYDGAPPNTVAAGLRYNGPDNAQRDQYGRFVDPAYRDLNAGFFHVAIANMMGRFRQTLVLDVSAGAEVWNHPLRSYQVLEQRTFTPQQAGAQFYRTNYYPFNQYATSIVYMRTRLTWITETEEDGELVRSGRVDRYTITRDYTYLLELDQSGQIIGGEWVKNSNTEHPDFMWFPISRPNPNAVTRIGLSVRNVMALHQASVNGRC